MGLVDEAKAHFDMLARANRASSARYPGEPETRQPVHTVYGGAQLYKADSTQRLGQLALASMAGFGRDALEFARGVGFLGATEVAAFDAAQLSETFARDPAALAQHAPRAWLAATVYQRVLDKLAPRLRPTERQRT